MPVTAGIKASKKAQAMSETAEVLESLGVVPDWTAVPELKRFKFEQLIEQRTRLDDEIKFREQKKRDLDEELQAALAIVGVADTGVRWEDRLIKVISKRSASRISPEKLLDHGVSADVIAKSTEPGKPYSYLYVQPTPKEK